MVEPEVEREKKKKMVQPNDIGTVVDNYFFDSSGRVDRNCCARRSVLDPQQQHTRWQAALHRRPIQWEFLYKAVSRNYRIIAAAGGRITQMSSYFIIVEIPFY